MRVLSFVAVYPLLFRKFGAGDVALWLSFTSLIGLQMMVSLGFEPTFARLIAYALGGLSPERMRDVSVLPGRAEAAPANYPAVAEIRATMRTVCLGIALVGLGLMATAGTALVAKAIGRASVPLHGWWAWWGVALTTSLCLWGTQLTAYLQGANHIPLLRRWEALSSLGSILSSCGVLVAGGGVLALVLVTQGWACFNVGRNWLLCRRIEAGMPGGQGPRARFSRRVFRAAWPSAWQAGAAQLASQGIVQSSSLVVAQAGSAATAASFLLCLRLAQFVTVFGTVPFTSKLPVLARLRAEGRLSELVRLAKRGMVLTHWGLLGVVLGVGLAGNPVLTALGNKSVRIDPGLWDLFGLQMLLERYGGMHQALYSLTNRVLALQVAVPFAGVYFATLALLVRPCAVLAVPAAMIVAQLATLWYTMKHSYPTVGQRFWPFEKTVAVPPLASFLLYLGLRPFLP